MSSRNSFVDPPAILVGLIVGIVAFLLIPGITPALLSGIGLAVLGYAVTLGIRSLGKPQHSGPKPSVGAAGDATAPARVRRGSATEVWLERGRKSVAGMQQMVASSTQPVIRGQLENVVLEAGDSLPVLEELATQSAVVQASLHRLSPAELRDAREDLQASLNDPAITVQMRAEKQRALDAVIEQEATLDRLLAVQAGLTARMESIVVGLERLSADMGETVATAAAPVGNPQSGDEKHLRDLSEQLDGLQAGLEESRRYTMQILGPQAE